MQHGAQLLENEGIERVGADIAPGTAPLLTAGAHWIVIMTVVIAMISAVASAHSMAAHANATVAAFEHVPQQPGFIVEPARTPLRVLPAHLLDRVEQFVVHDARHRNGDPLFPWAKPLAGVAPKALVGDGFPAIVIGAPNVGFIAQHAVDGRSTPDRFARGRRHLVEVEPANDLTCRIACNVVLEDAPDHRRFGFVRNQVRGLGTSAGHPAIAVGGFPEDYFATAGTPEFAAPITLGDLRALIFRDYALDLGQ